MVRVLNRSQVYWSGISSVRLLYREKESIGVESGLERIALWSGDRESAYLMVRQCDKQNQLRIT